jgi:hypothetical protein
MMTFQVRTSDGHKLEVSMPEFFALWERRLTLSQVLLQRKLSNSIR